jgi:hypothetical protein
MVVETPVVVTLRLPIAIRHLMILPSFTRATISMLADKAGGQIGRLILALRPKFNSDLCYQNKGGGLKYIRPFFVIL